MSHSDLDALLRATNPLVLADVPDERRFVSDLEAAAGRASLPLWIWTAATGLARRGGSSQYNTTAATGALAFVADLSDPGVFLFADGHPLLADPTELRAFKDAAMAADPGQTIIVAGPGITIPPELGGIAVAWTLQPPSDEELRRLIDRSHTDLAARGLADPLPPEDRDSLAEALRGLELSDAERAIQRAVVRDGDLSGDDVSFLRTLRAELLNTDGILELIESEQGSLDDVGGLDHLIEWLRQRLAAVDNERARQLGVPPPRGVLLTGVPGTGKSYVTKKLAAEAGWPLVLLDPARILRKYVGESEQRLERALEAVGSMAPADLWIDEIEKGLSSGGESDGGVGTRLLGTFLRWLQERPDGVFVMATANDVTALPPELLRKGRFDEIFFVDLPDEEARRAILTGHLAARGHDPHRLDVVKVAAATDGFSGAEVEAVVVGALYRALAADRDLETDDLVAEATDTRPLSVTRAEDIAALRSWAAGRTRPA